MITGFAAGILSGMGIGGGAILIPALGIFLGIGQREAQQINLLYFLPTAAMALFTHQNKGNIEKKNIWKLISFGLIGAAIGSMIAVRIDADTLRKGFGFFLLAMAFLEYKKGMGEKHGTDRV